MIANAILEQLGGGRFVVMTGARHLVSHADALSFKLPARFAKDGINYVKVTLTAADDYRVEFFKLRGIKFSPVSKVEGVYADMLRGVFEQATGLYTSLGSMGGGR